MNVYGSPSNCSFEEMSSLERNIVSFFQPYDNCKEVRTEKGNLVGFRITKELSIITASYGDNMDFHPDSLLFENRLKRASTRELFWSLFSQGIAPNEYVKTQRERLKHASAIGTLTKHNRVAFYELDAKNSPEPHSITYFFDQHNPDKYLSIGLTNIDKPEAVSLILNME